MTHAPALIRRSGSILGPLLRAGIPLGPNALVTIRGRTTGQPRTTPLAVVEIDGRRWLIGTYGDVHWTRNLRASGAATIRIGSRDEHVRGRELGHDEAATWFRDVLTPYNARQPLFWRLAGRAILKSVAQDIVDDPDAAARHRPVFELTPATA
jgi:deazaflavin-dependent oxidoreductase (nitroreductase family)